MYLWHWPVIVYSSTAIGVMLPRGTEPFVSKSIATGLSFLPAILSFHFLEEAFRHVKAPPKKIVRLSLLSTVLCAGISFFCYQVNGYDWLFDWARKLEWEGSYLGAVTAVGERADEGGGREDVILLPALNDGLWDRKDYVAEWMRVGRERKGMYRDSAYDVQAKGEGKILLDPMDFCPSVTGTADCLKDAPQAFVFNSKAEVGLPEGVVPPTIFLVGNSHAHSWGRTVGAYANARGAQFISIGPAGSTVMPHFEDSRWWGEGMAGIVSDEDNVPVLEGQHWQNEGWRYMVSYPGKKLIISASYNSLGYTEGLGEDGYFSKYYERLLELIKKEGRQEEVMLVHIADHPADVEQRLLHCLYVTDDARLCDWVYKRGVDTSLEALFGRSTAEEGGVESGVFDFTGCLDVGNGFLSSTLDCWPYLKDKHHLWNAHALAPVINVWLDAYLTRSYNSRQGRRGLGDFA